MWQSVQLTGHSLMRYRTFPASQKAPSPPSQSPSPPSTFSAFITIKQFRLVLNYIYMESYSGSLASFAQHCVYEIHPPSFFCPQLFKSGS